MDSITGVVRFAYGSFEIHPRAEDDIVFNATAEPGDIPVLSIYNLSYVSEDTDACETSYIGQHVTTHGYINALTHDGIFMQQHLTGMPFPGDQRPEHARGIANAYGQRRPRWSGARSTTG